MIQYATSLFERLGCRDYARFDFRADAQGTIKLLEVNPNPGWCWDGKFNLMAAFAEIHYSELLQRILEAARERIAVAGELPVAVTREPQAEPRAEPRPELALGRARIEVGAQAAPG